MKSTIREITTLSEDIKLMIKNAHGANFELIKLCRDCRDHIKLSDGKSVLNITQDDLVGLFDMNSNHYFLSSDQAFRLGNFCKLSYSGIIALILKANWEYFISQIEGYSKSNELNLANLLHNQKLILKYYSKFTPDNGKIIKLFSGTQLENNSNFSINQIEFIIKDLLEENNFLIKNEKVCSLYPEQGFNEKTMLLKVSKAAQDKYFRLKELWKVRSDELEELLFLLERKKRISINMEDKYFRTFGNYELVRFKLNNNIEKYKIILEAMSIYPHFSYRELVKLAQKSMGEAERKRNELKNTIARSNNYIDDSFFSESQTTMPDDFRKSYIQACKRMLTKLYFLLHSDTCPNYSALTEKKKGQINKLWLKLMQSTKNEELFSYSPTMLLYHLPELSHLEAIYTRACKILEIIPDLFESGDRLEFMINKGSNIDEIEKFLTNEIENLELHLAQLELVQNEYTQEVQSHLYRYALENISEYTKKIEKEIVVLRNQVLKLKKEISHGLLIKTQ